MDEKDINDKTKDSNEYKELLKIPVEERKLFQRNGVLIDGQKKILDYISNLNNTHTVVRNKFSKEYTIYELINWVGEPNYDQLQFLIELCWNNLIKKGETTSPMTPPKLLTMTFNYSVKKDIFELIKDDYIYQRPLKANVGKSDVDVLNESIKNIFNISRHWFQYKIPKWLSVMNELQKYICTKNNLKAGNYLHYSGQIENDFIRDNLSILSEYGIPTSAIRKIEKKIDSTLSEDIVIELSKNIVKNSDEFLEYEKNKILEL